MTAPSVVAEASPPAPAPPGRERRPVFISSKSSSLTTTRDVDGGLHRGREREACLPHRDASADPTPPLCPPSPRRPSPTRLGHTDNDERGQQRELAPSIFTSTSAAPWRGSGTRVDCSQREREQPERPRQPHVQREQQRRTVSPHDLVLRVAVMEEVHGVDVSWLHKPTREKSQEKDKPQHAHPRRHISAAPVFNAKKDANKQPNVTTSDVSPQQQHQQQQQQQQHQQHQQQQQQQNGNRNAQQELKKLPSPPNVTPPTPVRPSKDTTQATPSTPTPSSNGKAQPKRPNILGRQSSEKLSDEAKSGSRRQSWMNSLSSKFSSSQSTPQRPSPAPAPGPGKSMNGLSPPATNEGVPEEPVEEMEYTTPPKQKESSFFSSLTRRLSSASQNSGIPKVQGTSSCPRKVLNIDPNRQRCLLPEMDPNRLRKVSFCVDVEIAGGPRYADNGDDDDEARKQRMKEFKMKERAEGEALKRPEALKEEKEEEGEPKLESKSKPLPVREQGSENGSDENLSPRNGVDEEAAARKREKKKKSEEERKERKEKRRRRAEENGSIPVELSLDKNDDEDAQAGSPPLGSPTPRNGVNAQPPPQAQSTPTPTRPQDRPTTDPARIYRRCCQLRETPILKRITEQLMNPKTNLPREPGVVACLDLTGSRLQLADVVTLGDWLAVVPVKQLKLDDADLNDEGVRCILAGLLAAKKPEPTKRRSGAPKHREGIPPSPHKERAGVVERISFKNNPRISRLGWKHISLFLYMCRSLKAIDISMNQFPDTFPPSAPSTPVKNPSNVPTGRGEDVDAAEVLTRCLSERPAGARLEEFIVSECGLSAPQIRKIVDGCISSGVSRLGVAGNHLDDEGLEHIIHYLRSNVCQALDLGGNDLRGKLGIVADALRSKASSLPCWGLSLAGCNLDSASLKPLFATLVHLRDFRFIDLSHNRDLCSGADNNGLLSLLRRYISQMKNLKRVHLSDVGMSSKQAIALADVLPEGPRLAHLNLLENPQLSALADAKTEEDQEEACALYASLMAAVRVPSPESSEVVKALAKQVVAYSLRNMEDFAIAEATGGSTVNATAALAGPHGGEKVVKDISVPEVLWRLVGHDEDSSENHDDDAPAPGDDYIVGGTGVVKALQYVLGEKANDAKRTSLPQTPRSGTVTPVQRPGSSAGLEEQKGTAKKMSKNLLDSARKIRMRLHPALMKEASAGDEMAYRRLLFLDQTLQSIIERFEDEFPECRVSKEAKLLEERQRQGLLDPSANRTTQGTEVASNLSDDEDFLDGEDGEGSVKPTTRSRHNSDVSLANRKQIQEEGHLHRLGIQLRRDILASSEPGVGNERSGSGATSPMAGTPQSPTPGATASPAGSPAPALPTGTASLPQQPTTLGDPIDGQSASEEDEQKRIIAVGARIESISGVDLKQALHDHQGWENALRQIGANYEDLRRLHELDPEGWEGFKEAQRKARLNEERERGARGEVGGPKVPEKD